MTPGREDSMASQIVRVDSRYVEYRPYDHALYAQDAPFANFATPFTPAAAAAIVARLGAGADVTVHDDERAPRFNAEAVAQMKLYRYVAGRPTLEVL
jgi:hypothetical protein